MSDDYDYSGDVSKILSSGSKGATNAMQSAASFATSKKEAKEAKRRTIANLLNQALKRNQSLFRLGQDYNDEMNEHQANAMQQAARGFTESLHGYTKR